MNQMAIKLSDCFPKSYKNDLLHPFCDGNFHRLLEESHCTGPQTGWSPLYWQSDEGLLPGYLKGHSYGEYIFDWAWANFYQQHQVPYYPKLVHTLPFTPVNAPKIWAKEKAEMLGLIKASFAFYQSEKSITGQHFLFTQRNEEELLSQFGFITMHSLQYHWTREWSCFEEYLSALSKNRRKFIRKERKKIAQSDLELRWLKGEDLDAELMEKIYTLYLTTIDKKNSHAYLSKSFFIQLPLFMKEHLLVKIAVKEDEVIAMALFLKGPNTLYGRYWGIDRRYQNDYPGLHFELCYYQGMDYCFEHSLELFEAGAQGEQKLWRGFRPVTISSAHHLKLPAFHQAISEFVEKQNLDLKRQVIELEKLLPY
jgi:uncharacterized protein